MKYLILTALFNMGGLAAYCQNVNEMNKQDVENALKVKTVEAKPDSNKKWKVGANFNLNFTNTGLVNWQGGGQDALTITGVFQGFANYSSGSDNWSNLLEMGYGITRLGGNNGSDVKIRKSEDRFVFTSKYTKSVNRNWGVAGLFDFRSQFDKGFKYDVKSTDAEGREKIQDEFISDILSPAFSVASIGFEYKNGDKFYAMISPATNKATIVNDKTLSAVGAYGVKPGENIRAEYGAYMNTMYKTKIMENISFQSNLNLFMNYKTPQLIDVFWDNALFMTVNKYIQASFNTNLIYDDDIKILQQDGRLGPRVQFKHVLAIGLIVKLK